MNIKGLENASMRLLKYAQDLEDSDRTMYAKSKQSLAECIDIVQSALSKLQQAYDECSNRNSNKSCRDMIIQECADDNVEDAVDSKQAISEYFDIFEELPREVSEYDKPCTCAELINLWFTRRFNPDNYVSTGFSLKNIYSWVQGIIISYGHSVQTGTESEYVNKFREWCDSVHGHDGYIVPLNVYKCAKSLKLSDLNTIALGIEYIFKLCSKSWMKLFDNPHLYNQSIKQDISDLYCQCVDRSDSEFDILTVSLHSRKLESVCKQCNFSLRGSTYNEEN